jgi:hypothetical protein
MTPAATLPWPGGRTLAGWWPHLAPRQPRALWVAHLLLHRVEAGVARAHARRADAFTRHVLQAVAAGATVEQIDARLGLGPQLLRRLLHGLDVQRLARPDAAGGWSLTALGMEALRHGSYAAPDYERRIFHFRDRGLPDEPPHFLNLAAHAGDDWPAGQGWTFDPAHLRACVARPAEWKRRHGFPGDVEAVLGPEPEPARPDLNGAVASVPEWQRVVLDQPEHLLMVLLLVPGPDGNALQGFAVRQDGWELQAAQPALSLAAGWDEAFPELREDPPPEAWRQAWRAWCQPRSLPPADVQACVLERADYRLRVTATRALADRLRSTRSDVVKGTAWVLAGDGPVRPGALLELAEGAPGKRA